MKFLKHSNKSFEVKKTLIGPLSTDYIAELRKRVC